MFVLTRFNASLTYSYKRLWELLVRPSQTLTCFESGFSERSQAGRSTSVRGLRQRISVICQRERELSGRSAFRVVALAACFPDSCEVFAEVFR